MKRFAPFIACCYLCSLFLPLSLRANVLPVSESTVTGAAADDYYKSSRAQLKVLSNDKIGQTLIASEALSSTAALSGLVSGAAGLAGVAYYERTGKDPVYAAFNAVATAADALFVPAYQAFKANFVSPESYPATAAQYVGVEGSVGATLGNMMDYVKDKVASYPKMNSLVAANSTSSIPTLPDGSTLSLGSVINTPAGLKKVTSNFALVEFGCYTSAVQSKISTYSGGATQTVYAVTSSPKRTYVIAGNYLFFYTPTASNPTIGSDLYRAQLAATTDSPTATPESSSSVDYNGIKDGLASPSPDLAAEIKDAVKNLPDDKKITSSDPAPSQVPSSSPAPITNNQVQNFFAQNTTNVYNKTLETITNNATSEVAPENWTSR